MGGAATTCLTWLCKDWYKLAKKHIIKHIGGPNLCIALHACSNRSSSRISKARMDMKKQSNKHLVYELFSKKMVATFAN